MRRSVMRIAPIPTGLALAAFGVLTPLATAQADTPGPDDVLGVSGAVTAAAHPGSAAPSAGAGRTTTRATTRALVVNVPSCSESDLQAAIDAVATAGGTVNLKPRCTYTLTDTAPPNDDNGLPVIQANVTVNGSGDTITRAATAASFRFFEIAGAGNLTLNALTLSNGHASSGLGNGRGGAIWLTGGGTALTLNGSVLTANTADSFGGAIDNDSGTVSVNTSTLRNNGAAAAGGAVFVNPFGGSGTATFRGSVVSGNTGRTLGGGIAAAVGTSVTLTSTVLSGNSVTGTNPQGGAIAQAGTMTLNASTVVGNTITGTNAQGGGIFNTGGGSMQLTNSVVSGNTANGTNSRGGGIFNTSSGTVALTRTPVFNNAAVGTGATGGGIFNASGTVTLSLSPVFGNRPNNCGSPSTVAGCV